MHCDEKRMLFVLEEHIKACWKNHQDLDYQNETNFKELIESILEYNEFKNTLKIQ